ncbi:MAG TPA: GNAT family N-acetyltransferase [Actinomycetota bacterium]|nr:GNAT family N-acetyltransferase [Actinomycetota bacterium]
MTDPVAATASDGELVEAIEQHQTELSIRWAEAQDGIVVDRPGFVRTINPEIKVAFANNVHRIRLEPDRLAAAVRECTAAFREHEVPALWWVSPHATPQEPGRALEAHGWRYDEAMPWMAARMDRIEWPDTMPGLRIERVTDEQVHARFVRAMTAGFGMRPPEQHAMNSLADRVGYAPDAPWVRWVGSLDGRVVASSGLMLAGGVAGIYNVATAPEARRRGIGAALTAVAVAEGRGRGYEVAVLGASELGYGVYARMGFREVCRDRVWMLPERSKGTT